LELVSSQLQSEGYKYKTPTTKAAFELGGSLGKPLLKERK